MTELMKQLSLSVFGLGLGVAVLAAQADPALADRGKARWIDGSAHYAHNGKTVKRAAKSQKQVAKRKFDPNLDFETEAVWRNMRPEWFAD